MTLLEGKELAQALRFAAQEESLAWQAKGYRAPGLAVIQVGHDPASAVYVRSKEKACEKAAFASFKYELPESCSELELFELVQQLNQDPTVDGILCQLPLPKHIDSQKVIASLDPSKDVDAFHPDNNGRLLLGLDGFLPCTPAAVVALLKYYEIELAGKNVVILGRSNIVGKPLAILLLRENCTVTVCHSKTKNLAAVCRQADILISAMGRANMVDESYCQPQQVVIDVAINETADGKLCGDVDFASVSKFVAALTPVPGGVGPVTIAMLLQNTLKSYRSNLNLPAHE